MWVARDKNGTLKVFTYKPFRKIDFWSITRDWHELEADQNYQMISYDDYPITWEDEPVEVTLVNSLQYKNEKLAHEYMSAVYKEEHNDCLFNFVTE